MRNYRNSVLGVRSSVLGDQRLPDELEGGECLGEPPMVPPSACVSVNPEPSGDVDSHRVDLACAVLVSNPSTDANRLTDSTAASSGHILAAAEIGEQHPLAEGGGVAHLRRRFKMQGFLDAAVQLLITDGFRVSTQDNYRLLWDRWIRWCRERHWDPVEHDPITIVNYLQDLDAENVSVPQIEKHRSAISTLWG